MNSLQIRILIVDHAVEHHAALEDFCHTIGFLPKFASSGREAIIQFRGHHPDLVLLRTDLPDRQSDALLRRYYDDALASCLPIVTYQGDLTPSPELLPILTSVFLRNRFLQFLAHRNPSSQPYQGIILSSLTNVIQKRKKSHDDMARQLANEWRLGSPSADGVYGDAHGAAPAYVEALGLVRPLIPFIDTEEERTGFEPIDRLAVALGQYAASPRSVTILEGKVGSARAMILSLLEHRLSTLPIYITPCPDKAKTLVERFYDAVIAELTDFTAIDAGIPEQRPFAEHFETWTRRVDDPMSTIRSFLRSENRVTPRLCVLLGFDHPNATQMTELADLIDELRAVGMSLVTASSPEARLERTITLHNQPLDFVSVAHVPTLEISDVERFLHVLLRRRGAAGKLPAVTPMAAELLLRLAEGRHASLCLVLHQALHRAYSQQSKVAVLQCQHIDGLDASTPTVADALPLRPRHEIFADPRIWDALLPLAPNESRFEPRSLQVSGRPGGT